MWMVPDEMCRAESGAGPWFPQFPSRVPAVHSDTPLVAPFLIFGEPGWSFSDVMIF